MTTSVEVRMPALGQSVAEGTLVRWLKAPGESVAADESLVVVETDKAMTEVPSPHAGVLEEHLVPEGETVEVGTPIARLAASGAPSSTGGAAERTEDSPAPSGGSAERPRTAAATSSERRSRAGFLSPAVRRLVREHRLGDEDLRAVRGSGRGGRVTHGDLTSWLARRGGSDRAPARPASGEDRVIPLGGLRARVAEHVAASRRDVPEVNTVAEADYTRVAAARAAHAEAFRERHGFGLSWNAFLLKATATTLAEHPRVNATLQDGRIVEHGRVDLGLAVAIEPEGILVPVVRGAERLSVRELAVESQRLAGLARQGRLTADDMAGGTCTLTNPGVFGTLLGTPVIHQPQVAIVDFGAIEKRVVAVEDDAIAVRSRGYVVLAWDHRAMDGAQASRFLRSLCARLADWPTDSIDRA